MARNPLEQEEEQVSSRAVGIITSSVELVSERLRLFGAVAVEGTQL